MFNNNYISKIRTKFIYQVLVYKLILTHMFTKCKLHTFIQMNVFAATHTQSATT